MYYGYIGTYIMYLYGSSCWENALWDVDVYKFGNYLFSCFPLLKEIFWSNDVFVVFWVMQTVHKFKEQRSFVGCDIYWFTTTSTTEESEWIIEFFT